MENTENSFTQFEAKKYAFRQSKDGIIVSFVIHPDDFSSELATMHIGTRVLLAVAELKDDEPHGREADSLPSTVAVGENEPSMT